MAFLEKNPDADADGDGTVSKEERTAFNESRWELKLAEITEQLEQTREKLDGPDLSAGQIKELEGRLERLKRMAAEYSGALKSSHDRHR